MKTYSDERPAKLLNLGDGNWHFYYNTTQTEAPSIEEGGETRTQYVSDTAFISGEPTIAKIVAAVIREHYTDESIALMNALHQAAAIGFGDEPEGYSDYLSLVVEIRSEAENAINELEESAASEDKEKDEE